VYPPALHYHETSVARLLRRLAEQRRHALPFSPSDNWEAMFRQLDREAGLVLSEAQRQAVQAALTHPLTVLTGGPGTGKTTTLRAVLRLLEGKNCRLALVAPTGRAAKRLSEVTGYPAMTIHRLLGYTADGDFQYDERRPLPADMLIVDEASMLDVPLAYYLLRALLPETQVLFVGDADQLPPVQPGNFLRDLIDSGVAVVVRLQEIFRQAADSNIIRNAHRIHRGEMPLFPKDAGDFFLFPTEEPERAAELVVELVQERIPRRFGLHPLRDIQVLCPMYKGAAGVSNLNARLQAALNPPAPGKPERSFGIFTLRAGDKVMQLRNNYEKEVFNGDIGFVTDIDVEEQVIWVQMEDRRVPYDFGETDDLTLAYAISVHKSQGNEYPAVVLPLLTQHYMMLQRNLLYTAVTRARKLVVLVGSRRAISMAVNNARPAERYSLLKERLRGELPARPEGRLGDSDIVLLL
jgi:exodeoxyribonuclease V alpha subunit